MLAGTRKKQDDFLGGHVYLLRSAVAPYSFVKKNVSRADGRRPTRYICMCIILLVRLPPSFFHANELPAK